jgi:hypothetical protein
MTHAPTLIRPAVLGDLAAVATLVRALATASEVADDAARTVLDDLVADPHALLAVAEDHAGVVVGYVLAHRHLAFHVGGCVVWIEEVVVDARAAGASDGRCWTGRRSGPPSTARRAWPSRAAVRARSMSLSATRTRPCSTRSRGAEGAPPAWKPGPQSLGQVLSAGSLKSGTGRSAAAAADATMPFASMSWMSHSISKISRRCASLISTASSHAR